MKSLHYVMDNVLFQYPLGGTCPKSPYDVGLASDVSDLKGEEYCVIFPFSREAVDAEEFLEHISLSTGFSPGKTVFLDGLNAALRLSFHPE